MSVGLIEIPGYVTGEINRTDFGASYNGPIPGGGVALGEKVRIILEIEAVLQTAG